jgi:ribosomal protein RSM22 (predicted rRNA methylase)
MNWNKIDWDALEHLRGHFLKGEAGRHDYWRTQGDLSAYDQTFGRRIAWKWEYVLEALDRRGWRPPVGEVLDWGCGSGVAARAFAGHFGPESVSRIVLWDASRLAREFATRAVHAEFPAVTAERGTGQEAAEGTWLLSHVITELSRGELDALVGRLARATAVVWVEPGTFVASRALIAVRERLRERFGIVAPCTHQAACGLLAPGCERHWCHHFAQTPTDVYMDAGWSRFARTVGVDLRSLPVSCLVLDRRPLPPLVPQAKRMIGRPRVDKVGALLFLCDAEGVRDRRLAKRAFPREFRYAKNERLDTLLACECDGDEIVKFLPIVPGQE